VPAELAAKSGHHAVRVLLAEDDPDLRTLLSCSLRSHGFEVTEAGDGLDLVSKLDVDRWGHGRNPFDVVVTDVRMPGVLGSSVLAGLSELGYGSRVILISAFAQPSLYELAQRLGADSLLSKPFAVDELVTAVRRVATRL
jgi:DNA-binding response OmpR family regulator